MAENTRTQTAMKDMEDRITARLETRLIELTANILKALVASLTNIIQEGFQISQEGADDHGSSGDTYQNQNKGSNSQYSCRTRLTGIDFPRFFGNNVHQWIYQAESYFSIHNTPNDNKVNIAIIHLDGNALQWYAAFVRSAATFPIHDWVGYTKLLIDRFGEECDDPMADLMQLRQTSTVQKYREDFDALITRLQLSEEDTLNCFLGGLKKDIQMMVRMFQPDSVGRAFTLATIYETATTSQSSVATPFTEQNRNIFFLRCFFTVNHVMWTTQTIAH